MMARKAEKRWRLEQGAQRDLGKVPEENKAAIDHHDVPFHRHTAGGIAPDEGVEEHHGDQRIRSKRATRTPEIRTMGKGVFHEGPEMCERRRRRRWAHIVGEVLVESSVDGGRDEWAIGQHDRNDRGKVLVELGGGGPEPHPEPDHLVAGNPGITGSSHIPERDQCQIVVVGPKGGCGGFVAQGKNRQENHERKQHIAGDLGRGQSPEKQAVDGEIECYVKTTAPDPAAEGHIGQKGQARGSGAGKVQDASNRWQNPSGHRPRRTAQSQPFVEQAPQNGFLESSAGHRPAGEVAPATGAGDRQATQPPSTDEDEQIFHQIADIDPNRSGPLSRRPAHTDRMQLLGEGLCPKLVDVVGGFKSLILAHADPLFAERGAGSDNSLLLCQTLKG